jgi:hypothetical protein
MALFLKILCDISKQAKFIDAGPVASWLWLAGVGHCRLSSTDGFIHRDVVPTLVPGLKQSQKHAAELVRVGLWHVVPTGYEVHDYLAMNPSKAELAELARIATERKRDYRAKVDTGDVPHLSHWDRKSPATGTPHTGAGRAGVPASSPSPSGTGSEGLNSEESPRETVALTHTRPVRSFTRFNGLMGSHSGCFVMPDACAVGMCIPPWLGQQWTAQYRGDDATAAADIKAFVLARLGGLEPGQDPVKYWKAAWTAHHGAKVPQAPMQGKGNATAQAMSRAVERILAREDAKNGGAA